MYHVHKIRKLKDSVSEISAIVHRNTCNKKKSNIFSKHGTKYKTRQSTNRAELGGVLVLFIKQRGRGNGLKSTNIWLLNSKIIMRKARKVSYVPTANQLLQSSADTLPVTQLRLLD